MLPSPSVRAALSARGAPSRGGAVHAQREQHEQRAHVERPVGHELA